MKNKIVLTKVQTGSHVSNAKTSANLVVCTIFLWKLQCNFCTKKVRLWRNWLSPQSPFLLPYTLDLPLPLHPEPPFLPLFLFLFGHTISPDSSYSKCAQWSVDLTNEQIILLPVLFCAVLNSLAPFTHGPSNPLHWLCQFMWDSLTEWWVMAMPGVMMWI